MTSPLYPLRFSPLFRRYLWGGRRLATELGKDIGEETCAESWELVNRADDNSVVVSGALKDWGVHHLLAQYGEQLLGKTIYEATQDNGQLPQQLLGRFPLLLKFLDANKTLSVQVHPDDAAGMAMESPDLGKTEAWYVMDAAPGSKIYAGLKDGIDRAALQAAVDAGTTDQVVHSFEPSIGDCVFIPAGTVHAIGEGLLIAEIQQASDTTYRLFDWNRVDSDGNSRQLHVEDALAVSDYGNGPVSASQPTSIDGQRIQELIRCNKFAIRRWTLQSESTLFATEGRFRVLMVVDGEMSIEGDPCERPLNKGQTVLLPAMLNDVQLTCQQGCQFLEVFLP